MKINKIMYANQYNLKSNVSFGNEETLTLCKDKNGEEFFKCNIYEKEYNIKLTEETRDKAKLNTMIQNIKKTLSGFFVRYGKHEYFVPHILKKAPDILKQIHVVENGNAPLVLNEESVSVRDAIESQIKRKIDIRELKAIKFLIRTVKGYGGNNMVKTAYSYFDKKENDLYLYIPERKVMQVYVCNRLVKKIRF